MRKRTKDNKKGFTIIGIIVTIAIISILALIITPKIRTTDKNLIVNNGKIDSSERVDVVDYANNVTLDLNLKTLHDMALLVDATEDYEVNSKEFREKVFSNSSIPVIEQGDYHFEKVNGIITVTYLNEQSFSG